MSQNFNNGTREVNIGSGKGKQLPEPVLTQIYGITWHH